MDKKDKNLNVPNLRFNNFSDNWRDYTINDITKSCGGGTPTTKNKLYWDGNIPWISSSDLFDNDIRDININRYITKDAVLNSSTKLCPEGTICIVSRVGVGKVAVSECEICTSQDFMNIIDFNGNNYFLAQLLQNKIKSSQLQGTSIKGITSKEIKDLKVYIPCMKEQDKIMQFLSLIDEMIQTQNKIIDNLNTLKNGISNRIFKLNLIENSTNYLSDYLREGDKKPVDTSKYRKITIKLNKQGIAYSDINRDMADTRPFYIRHKGELIIGKQNYFNGSIAIVDEKYDNCICSNAIMSFNVIGINRDFLYFQISNNNYLNSQSYKANGTGQKELSEKEFIGFKIWSPPLEKQIKIANCFKAIEDKIKNEKAILDSYIQEKDYLLNNMFI